MGGRTYSSLRCNKKKMEEKNDKMKYVFNHVDDCNDRKKRREMEEQMTKRTWDDGTGILTSQFLFPCRNKSRKNGSLGRTLTVNSPTIFFFFLLLFPCGA